MVQDPPQRINYARLLNSSMFTIQVNHEFCAAHTISILGHPEPIHGHNFKTTATIIGDQLDDDGLLCDFHTVQDQLIDICQPFANNNLNETPPFDTLNPTAELIAKHIADELASRLDQALAPHAKVHAVSVTEAPGCVATYTRS
jgi:6-pyruvoyltetrahydropterin/6-carboxytetrahydropterin synthase